MWTRKTFAALVQPPVIGMVHLPPLPGAPRWQGDWAGVQTSTLRDAARLSEGGVGAVMVENYHDVPFFPARVPPSTVAAMTALLSEIRRQYPNLPLGVNVLRNDANAALAIAQAVNAQFIRVNVHAGAAVTDQGLLQGMAHHTLRLRRDLAANVGILADLRVKHAAPLVTRPLVAEARDLRLRALADGLIVTGPATGFATAPEDLAPLRTELIDCPLLVGSGITPQNISRYSRIADGYIVGTALKGPQGAIASERVAEVVVAVQKISVTGESTTGRKDIE